MGKAELPLHAPGTRTDRGYIGQSVPRPNAQRLLQGRGAYTDDLRFARLAHVAFYRSPYAHARIKSLRFEKALKSPGVIGVFDGRAVAEYCTPWVAVLGHLKGIKSPPQHAIAIERACWQGEAVAAVVAETRAQAEDALALIEAEWEELPAVIDMEESLAGKRLIHQEYADNICLALSLASGWKPLRIVRRAAGRRPSLSSRRRAVRSSARNASSPGNSPGPGASSPPRSSD